LRKGIRYYLSIKVALIAIFLLPVLAGIRLPFAPIQIIVLELFMDLGASAGFVAEPAERNIYERPPPGRSEGSILSASMLKSIAINGFFLFVAVMAVYFAAGYAGLDEGQAQTWAFSAWIFGHIALAYVSRSEHEPLYELGIFGNRVINLWALAAVVFLFAGIYLPVLNRAISLSHVPLASVIGIGLFVTFIIGLLEARKIISLRAGTPEVPGSAPPL
ncbi:MAG: cation transporting ATPase C-terminal domain-containing protein, partial [Methanoregulaceae archaeon]|nr:cation transporting ATPase C-terminal domain-containing protein [Methanoregulaceae archaeon]